ncbi:holin [Rhodococcus phage GuyFagieri]|nr:holin [Rhodococcus phage GuyFagieri]
MSEESGSPASDDNFPSSRFSKKQRRYVYELVRTGLPLLGLAGVAISPEVATAVMAFSMTVLGLGGGSLAISHLSD